MVGVKERVRGWWSKVTAKGRLYFAAAHVLRFGYGGIILSMCVWVWIDHEAWPRAAVVMASIPAFLATERLGVGRLMMMGWEKQVVDAREFVHRVQMYREACRRMGLYERHIQDRVVYLQGPPANCSYDLVMKDRYIKGWVESMKRESDVANAQRLNEGDYLRYEKEYETGAIFGQWNREMSEEFRESRKIMIDGLQKKIASPEDVLHLPLLDLRGYGNQNPDNIDPRAVGDLVTVEWEDGCRETFQEDVVLVHVPPIRGEQADCPTKEHYPGRKWK